MEVGIIEQKKYVMRFTLKGAGHTLCNLLRDRLWDQKDTKVAAYAISHPLIGIPEVIVETTSKDVTKAIDGAMKDILADNKKFLTSFKKAIK